MGIVRKEDIHSTFDDYIRDMHSNPNLLINGDFQVWQRGNTINCVPGMQYTSDRWAMWTGASPIVSNDNGFSLKWVTGGNDNLVQIVELPTNARGREMTLSFLVNIENGVSMGYGVSNGTTINNADGTQFVEKVYTGIGTWEKVVLHIPPTLPINNRMRIAFTCGVVGKTINISAVKLELGSKATPFVPRLFGEELALCQRYYEVIDRVFRTTGFTLGDGLFVIEYPFLVEKRVPPTVVLPSDKTGLIEVVGVHNSTPTNLESFTTIDGVRFTGILADDPNRIVGLNFRTHADAEIY